MKVPLIPRHSDVRCKANAFSLLEVMVAGGIFFLTVFAILALVSNTLRNARGLRRIDVDAGMVASQVYKTNKLYEGVQSGDFGRAYPEFTWETSTMQVATNGLFQVDIIIRRHGLDKPADVMSIWVYAPESPSASTRRP